MRNKILIWVLPLALFSVIVVFSIEESRTFVLVPIHGLFYYLKENISLLFIAFFLVKGKFVLMLFLKKIAFISALGLGKRYLIEKVIAHNFKIHLFDHISEDIKHLLTYIQKNFKDFPIIKQIMAGFVFLGSLGFVAKFMGSMLAMKVFIAKFWSFLLAIFLKVATGLVYFFSDYLWGSWIAPIVEVIIFTWILSWMEKVPFLAKGLEKIATFFRVIFNGMAFFIEKIFHIPVQTFLGWLRKKIQRSIYRFIGYKKVSKWQELKKERAFKPNNHSALKLKRKARKNVHNIHVFVSPFMRLKKKKSSK